MSENKSSKNLIWGLVALGVLVFVCVGLLAGGYFLVSNWGNTNVQPKKADVVIDNTGAEEVVAPKKDVQVDVGTADDRPSSVFCPIADAEAVFDGQNEVDICVYLPGEIQTLTLKKGWRVEYSTAGGDLQYEGRPGRQVTGDAFWFYLSQEAGEPEGSVAPSIEPVSYKEEAKTSYTATAEENKNLGTFTYNGQQYELILHGRWAPECGKGYEVVAAYPVGLREKGTSVQWGGSFDGCTNEWGNDSMKSFDPENHWYSTMSTWDPNPWVSYIKGTQVWEHDLPGPSGRSLVFSQYSTTQPKLVTWLLENAKFNQPIKAYWWDAANGKLTNQEADGILIIAAELSDAIPAQFKDF